MSLWTPGKLSASVLAAWWKAGDAHKTTSGLPNPCANGDPAKYIYDSSGNALNLSQETATRWATFVANVINGYPVLDSGANTTINYQTPANLATAASLGVFMVVKTFASVFRDLFGRKTTTPVFYLVLNSAGTKYTFVYRGGSITTAGDWANGANHRIVGAYVSGTAAAIRIDGSTDASASNAQPQSGQGDGNHRYGVMQSTDGDTQQINNAASAQYAEIVLYNGDVLATEPNTQQTVRDAIEGYMAWKYGLQANLPGGHPFAGAAPTVPDPAGSRGSVSLSVGVNI